MNPERILILLLAIVPLFNAGALTPEGGEEFVGPFASWANAKTDYGAVGDGITDDTAALQQALDALRFSQTSDPPEMRRRVLYLPQGTYRITSQLSLLRADTYPETHTESIGVSIIGEDPASTKILWDGPDGGTIFRTHFWYAKMSRITLDGATKAGTAIWHRGPFSMANEYSDIIFKDVEIGIHAGGDGSGIAETSVLRCKFVRCSDAGVLLDDWNSLDWFIRHCLFQNCGRGVTNIPGTGNFFVYQSLFEGSTIADLQIGMFGVYAFRYNTSIGSRMFLSSEFGLPAQHVTLQQNTIIDHTADVAVEFTVTGTEIPGTVMLLDNVFKSRSDQLAGPVILNPGSVSGDCIAIGNTYTVSDPIQFMSRLFTLDEQVVDRATLDLQIPDLPNTPPNLHRQVFDVTPGGYREGLTDDIQAAINSAAQLNGQSPVVHLAGGGAHLGGWYLERTLVVPANCDLQFIGDGTAATGLIGDRTPQGAVLKLEGPSRVTIRDMEIRGTTCVENPVRYLDHSVLLENCDQLGGQIFMQGCIFTNVQNDIFANGLNHTRIVMNDCYYWGSTQNPCLNVVGGYLATACKDVEGGVNVFSGMSCSGPPCRYGVGDGGNLLVRDVWHEGFGNFARLTGNGRFTLHAANGSFNGEADDPVPLIDMDGFTGAATVAGLWIRNEGEKPQKARLENASGDTKVLFAADVFGLDWEFTNASPEAQVTFLANQQACETECYTAPMANGGSLDAAFVRAMLKQTREAAPEPVLKIGPHKTDVRLFRVTTTQSQIGVELRAQAETCNIWQIFESQWQTLSASGIIGTEPLDLDLDGVPDLWTLALVAYALCHQEAPQHLAAWDAYLENLHVLDAELDDLLPYRESLAALLLVSDDLRDALIAPLGLNGSYSVLYDMAAPGIGAFSGFGNYDGDEMSNVDEYLAVLDWGAWSSPEYYAQAAARADWNQEDPPLPVNGYAVAVIFVALCLCLVGFQENRMLEDLPSEPKSSMDQVKPPVA